MAAAAGTAPRNAAVPGDRGLGVTWPSGGVIRWRWPRGRGGGVAVRRAGRAVDTPRRCRAGRRWTGRPGGSPGCQSGSGETGRPGGPVDDPRRPREPGRLRWPGERVGRVESPAAQSATSGAGKGMNRAAGGAVPGSPVSRPARRQPEQVQGGAEVTPADLEAMEPSTSRSRSVVGGLVCRRWSGRRCRVQERWSTGSGGDGWSAPEWADHEPGRPRQTTAAPPTWGRKERANLCRTP